MRGLSVCILALWLLLSGAASAATVVNLLADMNREVRQSISVENTALLPDTTLNDFCARAALWTSTDIGGVELQYSFYDTVDVKFYLLPDSVTEVLFTSVITSYGGTYSIKAWYPQFLEEIELSVAGGQDDAPPGIHYYNYWADSLQLLPIPARSNDLIIIKCFVEHQALDTAGTGNDTLRFTQSGYTEAAIDYACMLACRSLSRWDEAALWEASYEKKKASLKATYARKFEITGQR